jgi:hypothetical protein
MKTAVDYLVKAWVEQGTLYAEDMVKAKELEKQEKHAEYMRGWKDGYVKNETFKNK